MFHVVYLSFEENKVSRGYVGKHSSNDPYDPYMGSFSDKTFMPTSKMILEYSKTEKGAVAAEIRWQKVFQVVEDPAFANVAYQTSVKFSYSEVWSEERRTAASERFRDPELLCRISKKGKKEKESTREKKRRVIRGSWWTSLEGELRRSVDCPGQGWEKRRGGMGYWWVNPKGRTTQSIEKPEGEWIKGRKWREPQ